MKIVPNETKSNSGPTEPALSDTSICVVRA